MRGKDLIAATLFGGAGGSSGGGSSAGVSPKEVNFYDYDGTCVYAYSVAEAQALSELPAGPEHPGLVFQGWNWSLEGVKGLTRAMNIGAMYTTDDGTTRLYITLQEGRTSPMLGVGVNGTVTVDWGDGTEPDVLTGTSLTTTQWTPNHAYAAPGDYVIRLTVEGEMGFTGNSSTNQYACILRHASGGSSLTRTYLNALRKVEIGSGVTEIAINGFHYCASLTTVTIPDGVAAIKTNAFYYCYSLEFVVIPHSVTSIGASAFYQCYGLAMVAIPDSVTSISKNAFNSCLSLAMVAIPDSVTEIASGAFSSCYPLAKVIVSKNVSSIPSSVFQSIIGVAFFDFTAHTAVPTLESTNGFNSTYHDCEIRVPAALYDEWIAATNWSTYADYIKAY